MERRKSLSLSCRGGCGWAKAKYLLGAAYTTTELMMKEFVSADEPTMYAPELFSILFFFLLLLLLHRAYAIHFNGQTRYSYNLMEKSFRFVSSENQGKGKREGEKNRVFTEKNQQAPNVYNTNILFIQHKLWKFELICNENNVNIFRSVQWKNNQQEKNKHNIYLMTSNSFVVLFFHLLSLVYICVCSWYNMQSSTCQSGRPLLYFIINHKLDLEKICPEWKEEGLFHGFVYLLQYMSFILYFLFGNISSTFVHQGGIVCIQTNCRIYCTCTTEL